MKEASKMRGFKLETSALFLVSLGIGSVAIAQAPAKGDAGTHAEPAAAPAEWKASMVRVPEDQWGVPALWVDRAEVTVDDYRGCVVQKKCPVPEPPREVRLDAQCNWRREDRKRHPMNCVTFAEASAYCAAQGKRLPTEREWESAASGAKGTPYPWGTAPLEKQACWGRAAEGTCAVGEVKGSATAQGATDMVGNVWEWTRTCGSTGKKGCEAYVRKGGSYRSHSPAELTTTASAAMSPATRSADVGFRCAHDDPKP
jgi:formylglycine-generating enzyme required for sulfatase activity